jgi:ribose transport system substrate-binding protein
MFESRSAIGRLAVGALLAIALAVGLAACGSSSSDSTGGGNLSSSDLGKYEKAVEEGQAPVKWEGPTEAAKAPAGKTITVVTCTEALEGCKLLTEGSTNAAKAVHWQTHVINVTDPTQYDQAVQTAVSQGTDGIVLVGVDSRLISGGIKAAHAKNVPLVSIFQYNEPGPEGVDVEVSPDAEKEGKLLSDSMIVNEKGKVNVMFMPDSEFSLPVNVLAAAKKELESCEACEVEFAPELNFTAETVGTTLPGRVVGELQKDPSINSILVGFDPPTTTVIPAIESAGLQDQVKMYSQLGTTSALDFIRKGSVLVADIGASNEWGGWGGIDEMIRLLNGQETVDENVPAILLNKTNLPPAGQPFTGKEAGFEDKYMALWK